MSVTINVQRDATKELEAPEVKKAIERALQEGSMFITVSLFGIFALITSYVAGYEKGVGESTWQPWVGIPCGILAGLFCVITVSNAAVPEAVIREYLKAKMAPAPA